MSLTYSRQIIAGAFAFAAIGCASNRDKDAQALIDELNALSRDVETVVQGSPDQAGLTKAEGMINPKSASLNARVRELNDPDIKLTPAVSLALSNACVSSRSSAKNVRAYVYNAVLMSKPELRKRANDVARSLCKICETPSFATSCSEFDLTSSE